MTAEDLAAPFRLVWQWEVADREETLDTSLFSRSCELTLAGYSGAETLKHFPLLVRLATDAPTGFAYGNTGVNGCDLRFTDTDGNIIPHEIDTWNPSGESTVWVRVPSVSGQNTKIRLYYGVEDADLASLPENVPSDVWSDHLGVWHMNIDPTDKSTRDSTVGGMHGIMANGQDCDPASLGMIGGADSALALLGSVRAAKRPGGAVIAIVMPGPASSGRTQDRAVALAKAQGVEVRVVDVREACRRHLEDIGHDESVHDVVFENVQARERTQILMDIANQEGALVVGTGAAQFSLRPSKSATKSASASIS